MRCPVGCSGPLGCLLPDFASYQPHRQAWEVAAPVFVPLATCFSHNRQDTDPIVMRVQIRPLSGSRPGDICG